MGQSFVFNCNKCDYETSVSGGRDCGMLAVVQTMVCESCKELVDVLIGSEGQDDRKTGDKETDSRMGLCPKCKGKNVSIWEEPFPCPKCKGKMTKGRLELLWD